MRPWLKPVLASVFLLSACSAGAQPGAAGPKTQSAPTLLLATRTGLEAVSSADGVLRARVGGGVATADGSAIVATDGDRLVVRDARSGSVRRTVPVGAGLAVAAISPDGQEVALTTAPRAPYLPPGRTRSDLDVVDLASTNGTVRHYSLIGNDAPDTFSVDDKTLFLVSYLPAEAPNRYQITALDLASGDTTGVFGREKEPPEDMRGLAGMKTLSPDHTTLYTLYLRPPGETGPGATDVAEVHTLKLDQGWAHCIDLPIGFGGTDLSASALALSPDGSRLYVLDRAMHTIVEVDTSTLAIVRSASLPLTAGSTATALVVGNDGRIYVSDGAGIVVVGSTTLTAVERWPTAGPVTGLTAGPGGAGVLASSAGRVDSFTAAGVRQASTPVPSDATAVSLLLT